jgi:hypothetical protein
VRLRNFWTDPTSACHEIPIVGVPCGKGQIGQARLHQVLDDVELQKALNPPGEIRIERFGWTFCPGDNVMQVENNYDKEVYNGDLGVVSRIDVEKGRLSFHRYPNTDPASAQDFRSALDEWPGRGGTERERDRRAPVVGGVTLLQTEWLRSYFLARHSDERKITFNGRGIRVILVGAVRQKQ